MIQFIDDIERRGPTNARQRRALRRSMRAWSRSVKWTTSPSGVRHGVFPCGEVYSSPWQPDSLMSLAKQSLAKQYGHPQGSDGGRS